MGIKDRFWDKVAKSGSGCWVWTASGKNGYGCLDGKYAHRLSYQWHKGEIPEGMQVMHSCDNRLCVNPDHLSLGTNKDNSNDMMAKGRHRTTPKSGESAHNSRLTKEAVRQIRASTAPISFLAKVHGVHKTTISDVRRNKTWLTQ